MDAIAVRAVTKTYRVGVGRARVREMLPWPVDKAAQGLFPRWWVRNTFNALEDVTLSISAGSSVGIVGHNGAGKTTLLKVIAGVTEPTTGAVEVGGRVAALIDVLVGFHPDLTGRENVYLLGGIHGFSPRQMERRVERVFEFAEIDEMADTPIKRFSAGMVSRLGFATITAVDPRVLLVDEVLAVGDATFQRKCVGWLDDYRAGGGTLVFVSHNLGLVRNMTQRVVWLDHGRLRDDGPTAAVLGRYARAMEQRDQGPPAHRKQGARRAMARTGMDRWGAGGARVEEVQLQEPAECGGALRAAIRVETAELEQMVLCLGFVDEEGREIGAAASGPVAIKDGRGAVHCEIRPLPFRAGIYFPVVALLSPDGVVRDRWRLERGIVVDVDGDRGLALADTFGPVEIPAVWSEA